ncbi:hypothetical protein [Vibrio owensii]|uniref:hypothetical protein n=1 Tax=Vibrio owensii TaxID=696485 RepID=UPI003CE5A1D9
MSEKAIRRRFSARLEHNPQSLADLAIWNFSQSKKKKTDGSAQRKTLEERANRARLHHDNYGGKTVEASNPKR